MTIPELDAAIAAEQHRYRSALESIAAYVGDELHHMDAYKEIFKPSRGLPSAYTRAADSGSRLSDLLLFADRIKGSIDEAKINE